MKIYKKIFNEAVSIENLFNAWDEFKKGKRQKSDVQLFERNLEDNLFQLHRDLISKKYRHGRYVGFYIRDPKERHIHKATVRDRIVHHAIFQCLNPIFEPTFIFTSYSCRKNKGTHKAVKHLQLLARKVQQTYGQCFVLKCDIKKFFPTIDHKILMNIIAQRIKDEDMLWLIKANVDSFSSEFSNQTDGIKGTPIGNLTSQLFINIYMNELDKYIKSDLKVKHYIRYTDDFVVIHYNKNYLLETKNKIGTFLHERLKLSLHPNKVEIRRYHKGVDFLGYITLPKARLIRTKTKHRIFRKLKQKVKQFKNEEINEKSLIQSFNSYLGVLKHANSHKLEQKLRHKFWEWLNEL